MKNNGTVFIKPIDRELAKKICVENHYSKKWNTSFGKYNFGIFKASNPYHCLGVAVFGNMMLPSSYKKINSKVEPDNIVELNRLWIDDELGHNTETVFLSLCFKYFKTHVKTVKIVQSFADGRLGCGTIYKASNFKYYGFHETLFHEDVVTKEVIHDVNLHNTARLIKMIGENIGYIRNHLRSFHVKTYRYLYYLDKEYEKYSLLTEESYPAYSKGVEYVGFKQSVHVIARCVLGTKAFGLNELSNEFYHFLTENYPTYEVDLAISKAKENKSLLDYIGEKQQNKVVREINKYNTKYCR